MRPASHVRSPLRTTLGVPFSQAVKTPLCCRPSPTVRRLCRPEPPRFPPLSAAKLLLPLRRNQTRWRCSSSTFCCHLDDQNRDRTVTPGTSQVGNFLFLICPSVRDSGNRCGLLLLPAVVTLDEGGTGASSPARRCAAKTPFFPGGWEAVTAELLMVETWLASSFMRQQRKQGHSFIHARRGPAGRGGRCVLQTA